MNLNHKIKRHYKGFFGIANIHEEHQNDLDWGKALLNDFYDGVFKRFSKRLLELKKEYDECYTEYHKGFSTSSDLNRINEKMKFYSEELNYLIRHNQHIKNDQNSLVIPEELLSKYTDFINDRMTQMGSDKTLLKEILVPEFLEKERK